MTEQVRAHSGANRKRRKRTPTKPKNGPITVTRFDPRALVMARKIVASPSNSYTWCGIEAGEVWVR
jgi:hypothetical protein